uniref:Uncharacterized protein n=1 Tax=Glossina palpalis gambiensis TaxID=67801 RepID=A0A1B0BWN9_9MUSC
MKKALKEIKIFVKPDRGVFITFNLGSVATTVRTKKLFTIYSNHRKKLPKTVKPNNIAGTMMVRKARERLPVPVAARYSSSVLEIYLLDDFPISPINNEAPNEDQPRHAYRDAVDPGIVYTHQM